MRLDKTKLNFIAFCGFISLSSLLTFIGFFIFYAISVNKGFANFDFTKFFNDNKLAIIIVAIVFAIFDLVCVLCIWAIKWESDWCSSNKFIYGLLTLFIPFLIPFVFAIIGKNKINEEREEEMNELMKANLEQQKQVISLPYNPQLGMNQPNPHYGMYKSNAINPGTNYYIDNKPIFQQPQPNTNHPYNYVVDNPDVMYLEDYKKDH